SPSCLASTATADPPAGSHDCPAAHDGSAETCRMGGCPLPDPRGSAEHRSRELEKFPNRRVINMRSARGHLENPASSTSNAARSSAGAACHEGLLPVVE